MNEVAFSESASLKDGIDFGVRKSAAVKTDFVNNAIEESAIVAASAAVRVIDAADVKCAA